MEHNRRAHKGMPERERAPRRRRDVGQDASGTHHNIARDVLPPREVLSGTSSTRDNPWRFVLGCLSTKNGSADPPPRVKMLDTVLMEGTGGGQPEDFFYTGLDGTVKRKAERSLGLKTIEKEFLFRVRKTLNKAGQLGGRGFGLDDDQVVAIARTKSGEYVPITCKAFRSAVKAGAMPSEFDCLHPFTRAKDFDTTTEFANYQHRYILDDTGGVVPTGVAQRRVAMKLSGREATIVGQHRNLVLSRNTGLNAEISAAARSVVLAIERSNLCRVLLLDTEFVLDYKDEIWLVGVTSCKTVPRPMIARQPVPSIYTKLARCRATDERITDTSSATNGIMGDNEHQLATEVRSRRRKAEEASEVVNDVEFSNLLQAIGYRSPIREQPGGGGGGAQSRRRERPSSELNSGEKIREIHLDGVAENISEASISAWPTVSIPPQRWQETDGQASFDSVRSFFELAPHEESGKSTATSGFGKTRGNGSTTDQMPSPPPSVSTDRFHGSIVKLDQAATNRIHGSSQLEGCRGDFCDFDVGKRVREEEKRKYFIENTARAAGATDGLAENLSPLRLKILSMDDENSLDAPLPLPGGARPGGRGPRVARHSDEKYERREIPYKAVVQARKERVLVEAFLRRYAHGEDGEYSRSLGGGGEDDQYLVGGQLPGVYYQPVKVCPNCYMVYNLVDGARAQALHRNRLGKREREAFTATKNRPAQSRCSDRNDKELPAPNEHLSSLEEARIAGRGSRTDDTAVAEYANTKHSGLDDGHENSPSALSLASSRRAMDAVSQCDVSELRSFNQPPGAVAHVTTVAMSLLEGESNYRTTAASWAHARAAMGRHDFLSRLHTFDPRTLTPQQIRTAQVALENPGFDPAVMRTFSNAAGNLSLWALGVLQANRWMSGCGHPRTNIVPADDHLKAWGDNGPQSRGNTIHTAWLTEPPFPQLTSPVGQTIPRRQRRSRPSRITGARKRGRVERRTIEIAVNSGRGVDSVSLDRAAIDVHKTQRAAQRGGFPTQCLLGPATSPMHGSCSAFGFDALQDGGAANAVGMKMETEDGQNTQDGHHRRDRSQVAAQALASMRLANPGTTLVPGTAAGKDFICSDGTTHIPYRVCGDPAATSSATVSCNFVAVHDFFDNVDKTEVLFRSVTRRHQGCLALAFSYPGQAGTTFKVPPSMMVSAASRDLKSSQGTTQTASSLPRDDEGKKTPGKEVPNNTFVARKLHELLQHVHSVGEMNTAKPFHLVGIGNGVAIATAFALRYCDHPRYRSSLRSIVSINGFSSVDSQLAAILHSSINAFSVLPPERPDLPVSLVSKYIFSDNYLRKVGQNLALGIYTAVANPISLEGRHLLYTSALLHENLSREVGTLNVPIVLLQSTEDLLVNPANVDPFLRGRSSTHHFWSHEFRQSGGVASGGVSGGGEGASTGKGSVYGRKGLADLLRALSKPRGTFVGWVRTGHEVCQEAKRVVVDLLDALAKPTPEYTGVNEAEILEGADGTIGLYPSGNFVARINNRNIEEGENDSSRPNCLIEAREAIRAEDMSDEERDASILVESNGQRERIAENKERVGKSTTIVATPAAVISPFPKELMIPPLPACVGHRTPKTSPNKRSHIASGPTSADTPGRNGQRAVGRDREAQKASASAFSTDTYNNRRRNRRSGDRGSNSKHQSSRAFGLQGENRHTPKIVWKEPKPEGVDRQVFPSAQPQELRIETDTSICEDGGQDNGFSASYLPTSALVYDSPLSSVDLNPGAEEFREAGFSPTLDVSTAPLTSDQGLREPVQPLPSLELVMSDSLQRGKRRWIQTEGEGLDGSGELGERNFLVGCSPPSSATAATVGTDKSVSKSVLLSDFLAAEACLEGRLSEARRRAADHLKVAETAADRRIAGINEEQKSRSAKFAAEDRAMIAELETRLAAARHARAPTDLQRAVDCADIDDEILRAGLTSPPCQFHARIKTDGWSDEMSVGVTPVRAMPPLDYSPMEEPPKELLRAGDAHSLMKDAACDEEKMLRMRKAAGGGGIVDLEQFQRDQAAAATETAANRLATKIAFRQRSESDYDRAKEKGAVRVQSLMRGIFGRKQTRRRRRKRDISKKQEAAAIVIQKVARGLLARHRTCLLREATQNEIVLGRSTLLLQRVGRGMLGRRQAAVRRRQAAALTIQRCYRAHLGRRSAARQKALLEKLRQRRRAAVGIQSWWRCRYAVGKYARLRAHSLAAAEIQRIYRGLTGRRKALRRLQWERSDPGPARLKLGMRIIEDTKVSFERQRLEIAALHSAEEKAAAKTSRIRKELGGSEQELEALEREMREINHIEEGLAQLTHERQLVQMGLVNAGETLRGLDVPAAAVSGKRKEDGDGDGDGGGGAGGDSRGVKAGETKIIGSTRSVEGFALEMQIQITRAEREKRKQELEADFRSVSSEVELKQRELESISNAIAEIELTRQRKSSEFRRLQANLMELLREQKAELDAVKAKGMQLEVATATTAAVATATAQRAKHHEEQSSAMYSQTEELMKFQFMSMSLSYFSSLNMLKTMKNINSDTTTAAVTSSADAAAAAAAASAAASLPAIKAGKVMESVTDVLGPQVRYKDRILQEKLDQQEERDRASAHPFPSEVKFWSTADVGFFLSTLGLPQYRQAFEEAAVDGELLLALDQIDCADVLGVEHALHSKKLFMAINKLRPLSQEDRKNKGIVEHEKTVLANHDDEPPDVETVFSQVRNGRLRRLEDSLDKGFPVDTEDEFGNTALIVACQNCNLEMCEMLLRRSANVDHANSRGNSPLHYAMAYDTTGVIGEMLISKGGDDTAANNDGLSCYDGLGESR